jgi:hypothetical protein
VVLKLSKIRCRQKKTHAGGRAGGRGRAVEGEGKRRKEKESAAAGCRRRGEERRYEEGRRAATYLAAWLVPRLLAGCWNPGGGVLFGSGERSLVEAEQGQWRRSELGERERRGAEWCGVETATVLEGWSGVVHEARARLVPRARRTAWTRFVDQPRTIGSPAASRAGGQGSGVRRSELGGAARKRRRSAQRSAASSVAVWARARVSTLFTAQIHRFHGRNCSCLARVDLGRVCARGIACPRHVARRPTCTPVSSYVSIPRCARRPSYTTIEGPFRIGGLEPPRYKVDLSKSISTR